MILIDFLSQRSSRERRLIAILLGIVAPLALLIGVLVPLHERRLTANTEVETAQALNLWVADRAREAQTQKAAQTVTNRGSVGPPVGLSGIEQSLVDARLRPFVSRLEAQANGAIGLEFESVSFVLLMEWLDAEDQNWGYYISQANIEKSLVPSQVTATIGLTPAN